MMVSFKEFLSALAQGDAAFQRVSDLPDADLRSLDSIINALILDDAMAIESEAARMAWETYQEGSAQNELADFTELTWRAMGLEPDLTVEIEPDKQREFNIREGMDSEAGVINPRQ